VEVHPNPEKALSDSAQTLSLENFQRLMDQVEGIARLVGEQP
jgi:3-deoxy-7-phosphoheptulonate synthase